LTLSEAAAPVAISNWYSSAVADRMTSPVMARSAPADEMYSTYVPPLPQDAFAAIVCPFAFDGTIVDGCCV
jgi:hypothetical protein